MLGVEESEDSFQAECARLRLSGQALRPGILRGYSRHLVLLIPMGSVKGLRWRNWCSWKPNIPGPLKSRLLNAATLRFCASLILGGTSQAGLPLGSSGFCATSLRVMRPQCRRSQTINGTALQAFDRGRRESRVSRSEVVCPSSVDAGNSCGRTLQRRVRVRADRILVDGGADGEVRSEAGKDRLFH
jgi:hypothetical protein